MLLTKPLRIAAVLFFATASASAANWVTTWSTAAASQLATPALMTSNKLIFNNQTLREVVHISQGGSTFRVRISNLYSSSQLVIDSAHIARRATGSSIDPATDQPLTFNGQGTIIVPPNAIVVTDPVQMDVPAMSDITISFWFAGMTSGAGIHYSASQTNYLGNGLQTDTAKFTQTSTVGYWAFLAGVDVAMDSAPAGVVCFGDSITDGAHSTSDANHRWPDVLAARLLAARIPGVAVSNAGIGGNRILHDALINVQYGVSGLARFNNDVFSQPGIRYLLILEGINDLGHPGTTSAPLSETVTSDDIIFGLKQMADRAHAMGIKVYGATITPFGGYAGVGYYTDQKEAYREAVNAWIRTGQAFDAVIDFDMVVRDPNNPNQIFPAYDSGDHLHPGDAGYQAMANSIDLSLFTTISAGPVINGEIRGR